MGFFAPVLYCRFTGSDVRVRDDEMPHAHIAVAVEGAGWPNPDNIPLMITNTLIGTWDRTVGGGSGMAGQLALECSRRALCNSFQVLLICASQCPAAMWTYSAVQLQSLILIVQYCASFVGACCD